jgi:hypothetical protein
MFEKPGIVFDELFAASLHVITGTDYQYAAPGRVI